MPNRILREGILTSPRMKKLGWAEEVFYRRLHSVVDDFGRYFADPGLLRAACYPRQLNKVSDPDIGKWLHVCVDAGLVRVYPAADGESYLEVFDFGQQVRAKKSKYPEPLDPCVAVDTQVLANAHLDVSVSEVVSEAVGGDVSGGSTPRSKSTPDYSEDFEQAYRGYPARPGSSKPEAYRAWKARIAAGVDVADILGGVARYAEYCRVNRTEPQFIKQASTFFGPDHHYMADWSVPVARSLNKQEALEQSNAEKADAWARRIQGEIHEA